MRVKPPKILRRLMPSLVWDLPTGPDGRDVYLTFDDGPTPGVTEWILDELRRWGARATFFCLGANVEKYPELYARILSEGHRVGNHTHRHKKGWNTRPMSYAADALRAAEFIDSDLFRPPYGSIMPRQARILGNRYNVVMWNIISRDYNTALPPEKCLATVVGHVRPGDIVVFHDSQKAFRNMSYALPRVLEYLHANGLKCKSIEI